MPAETDASRFDDRLARMEATMREMENVQSDLKTGQRWITWAGGSGLVVLGIVMAVVGVSLGHGFSLSDRVAQVQVDTGKIATAVDFMRDDISEIKADTKALRSDVQRVAEALGAKLEERRTELTPR